MLCELDALMGGMSQICDHRNRKQTKCKTAAVARIASGSEGCVAIDRELKFGSGRRAAVVVLGALGGNEWSKSACSRYQHSRPKRELS